MISLSATDEQIKEVVGGMHSAFQLSYDQLTTALKRSNAKINCTCLMVANRTWAFVNVMGYNYDAEKELAVIKFALITHGSNTDLWHGNNEK